MFIARARATLPIQWGGGSGIPTLLKMEFEGGVVLKFNFKIQFLQSCFLNDQYPSSFHVIGKQVKIKYLRLAPSD